jgi:hypothetical protein
MTARSSPPIEPAYCPAHWSAAPLWVEPSTPTTTTHLSLTARAPSRGCYSSLHLQGGHGSGLEAKVTGANSDAGLPIHGHRPDGRRGRPTVPWRRRGARQRTGRYAARSHRRGDPCAHATVPAPHVEERAQICSVGGTSRAPLSFWET